MISINGEKWEVLLVPPFDPLLHMRDDYYAIGVCDDKAKIIAIDNELNDYYLKKVLCHELTHAAMFRYNVDLSHTQEELVADLMSIYGQEIIHKTNEIFQKIG